MPMLRLVSRQIKLPARSQVHKTSMLKVSSCRQHAFGLLLAAAAISGYARADVTQGWFQNTGFLRLDERWSVGLYLDLRVTDVVGELATTMFSPRVRYDLSAHWSAQVNTTWLEAQAADARGRTAFTRLEFELNPRCALSDRLTFSARNRVELRWIEDVEGINERLRLRPQLDVLTPWAGPVQGVFINNEVFYDFDQQRVTENRLTPFGVVFRPAKQLEFRVYHLWRHARARDRWFDFHVLGMHASVNF